MKPERLTAMFFLSVTIIFMLLVPVGLIGRVEEKRETTQARNSEASINWQKLYPFPEGTAKESRNVSAVTYQYIKNKVEDFTSGEYLVGGMKAVEAAKKYEEIIGWNIASPYEYNGIMRLSDGCLTWIERSKNVSPTVAVVSEFADYCKSKGLDFLYVLVPSKICVSEDKDIAGVLDFSNQNADKFLELLDEKGVRAYDLRKLLHEDGMNHHEAFFRTDHHWKPESGLWASRYILQFMRDDLGWNVKPEMLAPDNFDYVIYPEWFLGSQGKKFMLSRIKPDDFTMIYPKYDTNIRFEIPTMNIDYVGDFKVTYNMSSVVSKDYYNLSPYHAYSHGEPPVIKITNFKADNNKSVLLIRDSYSDVVIPFVAMGVKHIEAIDLRGMTGSIKRYIEANHPDLVVIMYPTGVIGGEVWSGARHADFR
ncbi:MAG: hypothetical protein IJS28_12745 [Synergistaceae bacterium]|nr:hypothetical protein [Synergistaceae bacterium]